MEIFHGTRQRFEKFDVSFKGTGEAGAINACWFTDNFEGAKRHAIYKNRNTGGPLVYRCELTEKSLIADHRKPLSEQPHIAELLHRCLPISVSSSLAQGREWHLFSEPQYLKSRGKTVYTGRNAINEDDQLDLYRACGIHAVYDWEGIFTDGYLNGTTTIVFDFSYLEIKDIIEVS